MAGKQAKAASRTQAAGLGPQEISSNGETAVRPWFI
jgi:hypothetical protein